MTKQIRFNAFQINSVGHQSPGLWCHPRDQSHRYTEAEHWIDFAKLLERGLFDGVFLADVLGVYDVFQASADAALRGGVQVPLNDPLALIPLMAYATKHLGFGVTCALTYEHPYSFARRMSTLDHLSKGRVAWNIVTGYLDSAARNLGLEHQIGHDARYDIAEEYMDVVYKLWEQSWEDNAVKRDKKNRVFTDPSKVHPIRHHGENYRVPGFHLCEPSPQRTPLLFQAGTSGRGKNFAGKHAECVFVSGPSKKVVKQYVNDLRAATQASGRDGGDILIYAQALIITGANEEEAKLKHADYLSHIDIDAALALLSGWTGVDFSQYAPNATIEYMENDAGRSALASFSQADPTRRWTVREAAEFIGLGGRGPVLVGSPQKIADELIAWVDETGIDGFNLAFAVTPDSMADVVDFIVPELQKRGRYRQQYQGGTLRAQLFGKGDRLPENHPGRKIKLHSEAPHTARVLVDT